MKAIYLVFLLCTGMVLFGKDEYKYGKITPDELNQKFYPADSQAGAVILYSIGETQTKVNPNTFDISTVFTKREKIKFYDKNSLGLANQTLVLYDAKMSSSEVTVYGIKGKTYNMEGGKIVETDLPKSSVRIDKLDDYHDIVHFAFSNVKEGSVIEYEIELSIPGASIPTWYFQQSFPVLYSEFNVNMAEFFKYRRDTKGYLSVPMPDEETRIETLRIGDETLNYNVNSSVWKMRNIPAFVEEPYVQCNDNYISQLYHELLSIKFPNGKERLYTTNWAEVVKKLFLDPYHGGLLNSTSGFLNTEYDQVKDIKDNVQRMQACYKAIQNKMSWNGSPGIFSLNFKDAYRETKGSSADISFLLIRLLKDCNIQAYPVILSTRKNGFVPRFPSYDKFNYVIVQAKVNGQSYLLDASEKYLSPGILPPRCLNDQGLVIKELAETEKPEWVDLSPKYNATTISSVEAKLSDDGSISGKVTYKKTNYAALETRRQYQKSAEDKNESILKNAANGTEIVNYKISNLDSLNLPTIENFEFNIRNKDKDAGTTILSPILFEKISDNPFKIPERKYPIEFDTPLEKTYVVNISLPAGIVPDEVPKSIAISMPDNTAKFTYQLNIVNNSIQLTAKLSIKKTIYSQDEYPYLKEFFAQFISKMNEPVLLQRK